jgi:hypothetical protein
MNCPHCTTRVKKVGDYVPPTCGKSECQEAEFRANQARNAPKPRKKREPVLCPNCLKPDPKNDHYDSLEGNSGGWTCQAAMAAPVPSTPRRLKPKEGALKADGTRWTSQPGGIEKLELEVPTPTSNEHVFARLLVEIVGQVRFDHKLMSELGEGLGIDFKGVNEILDRAEAVVDRVKKHRS